MRRVTRLILLLVGSIIFYLPVSFIHDTIWQAYYFVFYGFLVMVMILIVLFIEYRVRERKPAFWVIFILITIVLGSAPHKATMWYLDLQEWIEYGKEVQAEEIQDTYFSNPSGLIPPMKYVHVEVQDGHILLKMEYDPEAFPLEKYDTEHFADEISRRLVSDASMLARHRELKYMSAEVIFALKIKFVIDSFPLRDGESSDWGEIKDRIHIYENKTQFLGP